jgi:hypothetical protein
VARAFILAGSPAFVGALLGAYLIKTRISRLPRRIAVAAARVDAGDLHPRIHMCKATRYVCWQTLSATCSTG